MGKQIWVSGNILICMVDNEFWGLGCSSVVEHLFNRSKVGGSNHSTLRIHIKPKTTLFLSANHFSPFEVEHYGQILASGLKI